MKFSSTANEFRCWIGRVVVAVVVVAAVVVPVAEAAADSVAVEQLVDSAAERVQRMGKQPEHRLAAVDSEAGVLEEEADSAVAALRQIPRHWLLQFRQQSRVAL